MHTKNWVTLYCRRTDSPVVCVCVLVRACACTTLKFVVCVPFHGRLGSHAAGSTGRRELCGLCPLLNIYRCAREKEENQIFIFYFFLCQIHPVNTAYLRLLFFPTITFDNNAKSSAGTFSHKAVLLAFSIQSTGVYTCSNIICVLWLHCVSKLPHGSVFLLSVYSSLNSCLQARFSWVLKWS